jgi:hypothetical protein
VLLANLVGSKKKTARLRDNYILPALSVNLNALRGFWSRKSENFREGVSPVGVPAQKRLSRRGPVKKSNRLI